MSSCEAEEGKIRGTRPGIGLAGGDMDEAFALHRACDVRDVRLHAALEVRELAERHRAVLDEHVENVELRRRIAHELIHSLQPEDAGASAAWSDEIHRRIDEIEAGTAELDDWESVRARLESAGRK